MIWDGVRLSGRLVADGAGETGHVDDNAGFTARAGRASHVEAFVVVAGFLFGDSGECAKEEAVDVGEDGGTAWGDAALLEGEGEVPELGVDIGGRFFFGNLGSEEGGEVDGVVAKGCSVTRAEGGVRGGKRRPALTALGGAVLAASV